MDTDTIDEITDRLLKRAKQKALCSASANLIPIPGVGLSAEVVLIIEEIKQYLIEYQIDKASIQRFSDLYDIPFRELSDKLTFSEAIVTGKMAIMEFINAKLKTKAAGFFASFVPLVGNFVSAGMSYASTGYFLEELIQNCSEDAKRLSAHIRTTVCIRKEKEEDEKRQKKEEEKREKRTKMCCCNCFVCCFVSNKEQS